MKVWKDKQGNALDSKEFLAKWKKGIQAITPLQQASINFKNHWIIIFGIICGLVISLFHFKNYWWASIILVGALINSVVQQIGNYQKLIDIRRMESVIRNS